MQAAIDHLVVAATDLDAGTAWLEAHLGVALAPGDILDLARGDFSWRITVPADGHLPGDGLVPSLIQWHSPMHPADKLPDRGCGLMKLEGFHPEPKRIQASLSALGLDKALALFPAEAGERPGLAAYLRTPGGLREID